MQALHAFSLLNQFDRITNSANTLHRGNAKDIYKHEGWHFYMSYMHCEKAVTLSNQMERKKKRGGGENGGNKERIFGLGQCKHSLFIRKEH